MALQGLGEGQGVEVIEVAGILPQPGCTDGGSVAQVYLVGVGLVDLADAGASLLTDVSVDDDGHEQFFAADDPATGLQLGFISRTGHRVGVGTANVLALFDALDHH